MPESPKLLVVGATPPVDKPSLGGNERYLLNVLELARSMGIATFYISDGSQGYEALLEQAEGLGAQRLTAPFCTDAAAGAAALDAAIDEIRPELLLVNGHSGWLAPAVTASRRLPSVQQRVYTMHLPLGSLEIQAERRFDWTQRLRFRWAGKQLVRDRRFLNCFAHVLTVSRRFGDLAVELGYLRREQVRFVPNGVDTERFQPRQGARRDGPVRIGAACRLTTAKRVDLLLDAFARLHSRTGAELHIAGEGPEAASLHAQTERLGVSSGVRFHGFRRDVPAFLAELDVFAITSDEEAAPYSQLEAMACGLPAVVTAVGDLPYIVRDGIDGLVAPKGDAVAVAAKLERLVAEADLRESMGKAARDRAVEEFSSAVWTERMRRFFTERMALRGGDAW
jgi:glycosyltransferase involved in cell wall biosynthesis